jgi:uncharacterized surface protein with fasciclin (FAS1) repeats
MKSVVRLSRDPEQLWRWFLISVLELMTSAVSFVPVTAQDAETGWLRFAQFAEGAPNLEVLLDGQAVWSNWEWGWVSDFVQTEAGTHQLSVVPSDEEATLAPIDPVELNVEARHHITAVIMGQPDEQLVLYVIDDTESCPQERLAEGTCLILIHNIAGAPAMTIIEDGQALHTVAYDEPTIAFHPSGNVDTSMIVAADDPDTHLFEFDMEADGIGDIWEPNMIKLVGFMGHYPGQAFEEYGARAADYSPANAVDLMAGVSGLGLQLEPGLGVSYDTLLAALEAAGLTEMLRDSGPYTLFAPTDGAFANLPEGTLDALMAELEALRAVLLNHIVEGDLSEDDLLGQGTVTTLGGTQLTITDSNEDDPVFNINNTVEVDFWNYRVANGRVYTVWNMVIMPEDE